MAEQAAPEFCLLWIDHWSTCMSKAEWGSWAQAVGTTAGVAAAIWVVQHQLRQTRRAAQVQDASRLLARARLLHYVSANLDIAISEQRRGDERRMHNLQPAVHECQEVIDALQRVELSTATNSVEIVALVEAREHLRLVRDLLSIAVTLTFSQVQITQMVEAKEELDRLHDRLFEEASHLRAA